MLTAAKADALINLFTAVPTARQSSTPNST